MDTQQDAKTAVSENTQQETKTPDGLVHCRVYSPYKTYFDGNVKSVSGMNDTGNFDILAKHHNFLSLLVPCDIVIRGIENAPADREEIIKISRAIMQVKPDDVVIFLDI